jgi:hypothetical protein
MERWPFHTRAEAMSDSSDMVIHRSTQARRLGFGAAFVTLGRQAGDSVAAATYDSANPLLRLAPRYIGRASPHTTEEAER